MVLNNKKIKLISQVIALVALGALLVLPLLNAAEILNSAPMKSWLSAASVVWFLSAWFWLWKGD